MKKIGDYLKKLCSRQFLASILLGFLLLVSTACSKPPASVASDTGSYKEQRGQSTELYAPTQEKKGGMNEYSDVDSRRDTSVADAKAKALIDRAKVQAKDSRNPKEVVQDSLKDKSLGKRTKEFSEDVSQSVKESADDLNQGTQRGLRNFQKSTDEVKKGAEKAVDSTAHFVQDQARDTAKATQDALETAADQVRNPA
jgi:hypothetical protein